MLKKITINNLVTFSFQHIFVIFARSDENLSILYFFRYCNITIKIINFSQKLRMLKIGLKQILIRFMICSANNNPQNAHNL
jgi:hypothetical protein